MNPDERRAANEESVQSFFARWDPGWRWILILGMRDMRTNLKRLGSLASAEANDEPGWQEDTYVYGPLAHGLTAAAVNEVVQHCEDLWALLKFLREPEHFARDMGSYRAGTVVEFGRQLSTANDDVISRLFLVPDAARVQRGMKDAADPQASIEAVEAGRRRLGELVRSTADFYRRFEDFHVQYKHGLKMPLRPFGEPTAAAITDRKSDARGPLFLYTNEPLEKHAKRHPDEQAMMFLLGEAQRTRLTALVGERNLLRLRLVADVDFDDLVERSYIVMRLLQIAQTNRLAVGQLEDGHQHFALPGAERWEQVDVLIGLDEVLSLSTFANPADARNKRRRGR